MRKPVSGMAITAPAAIARSATPKTAGPTAMRSIASGIRGAQFPQMKPWRKKIAATAQRAFEKDRVIAGESVGRGEQASDHPGGEPAHVAHACDARYDLPPWTVANSLIGSRPARRPSGRRVRQLSTSMAHARAATTGQTAI